MFVYVMPMIILSLAAVNFFIFGFEKGYVLLTYILAVIGVILYIRALMKRIKHGLIITSKRTIIHTGIFSKKMIDIRHNNINIWFIKQSIFGQIFKYGDLILTVSSGAAIHINGIYNPIEFRQKSLQIIDKITHDRF